MTLGKTRRTPYCRHRRAVGTIIRREAGDGITGAATPASFIGNPSSLGLHSTNASYRHYREGELTKKSRGFTAPALSVPSPPPLPPRDPTRTSPHWVILADPL